MQAPNQFLYNKYKYLNIFCGAQKRTSNFLELCLITVTYFWLELKSGPESGPLRSEGRHLYSRTNSKSNRAAALAE